MNRAAAGVGSWLEVRGGQTARLSLDAQAIMIDLHSFSVWQAHREEGADTLALHALVRELFAQLEPGEQAVLRGIHLEGKSARAVAQAMGVHHSAVGRLRARAEEKLKGGLAAVMRYRALEKAFGEDADDGF